MADPRIIGPVRARFGQQLEDPQGVDPASRRQRKQALAHIRNQERTVIAKVRIARLEPNRRRRTNRQWNGIDRRDAFFAIKQLEIAKPIVVVEPGF